MQTNFFRQLASMNLTGDLQITLRPTTENSFVLSVLLNNEQCGDEARKIKNLKLCKPIFSDNSPI